MNLPLVLHRADIVTGPIGSSAGQTVLLGFYDRRMGLNPFRPQKKNPMDVAMVVGALTLTIAAVAWAFLGT